MAAITSGLLAFGGNASQLLNMFKRIYQAILEYNQNKDTRERIVTTLQVERLQNSIEETVKVGLAMKEFFENAEVPFKINESRRLYHLIVEFFNSESEILSALHQMAGQADGIMKFENFMEELKKNEPALHDLIKMLSRSFQKGILSMKEFPIFMNIYGPKKIDNKKINNVKIEITPIFEKIKAFKDQKPQLFRGDEQAIRKAYKNFQIERKKYDLPNENDAAQLVQQSPDWMQEIIGMLTENIEEVIYKKRDGFRELK